MAPPDVPPVRPIMDSPSMAGLNTEFMGEPANVGDRFVGVGMPPDTTAPEPLAPAAAAALFIMDIMYG